MAKKVSFNSEWIKKHKIALYNGAIILTSITTGIAGYATGYNVAHQETLQVYEAAMDGFDEIKQVVDEQKAEIIDYYNNNNNNDKIKEGQDPKEYIAELSVKIANYQGKTDINGNEVVNFLYSPDDQNTFYDKRITYADKINGYDDPDLAKAVYDQAKQDLDGILKHSAVDYQNACNYYQTHEQDIKDLYNTYDDFDFYRDQNGDIDVSKDAGGIYDADGYSVVANQYHLTIMNPNEGFSITINPNEKASAVSDISVLDRGTFMMYGSDYYKQLENYYNEEGVPHIGYDELKEHGCFSNNISK